MGITGRKGPEREREPSDDELFARGLEETALRRECFLSWQFWLVTARDLRSGHRWRQKIKCGQVGPGLVRSGVSGTGAPAWQPSRLSAAAAQL